MDLEGYRLVHIKDTQGKESSPWHDTAAGGG